MMEDQRTRHPLRISLVNSVEMVFLLYPSLNPAVTWALTNFQKRSFGLWDGNKIQTGFLSLPDPKISKYTAFDDNYQGPSCRVDLQPVEQQDLGLLPVFTTKDVFNSTSAPMDYQAYRSYTPRTVQPFAVDAKQADVFAEMQKWKGFCKEQQITTTGFPCPSQGVVRMGGILSGEGCGGVSVPVAIKKHYADRLQTGIWEEESWKSDNLSR